MDIEVLKYHETKLNEIAELKAANEKLRLLSGEDAREEVERLLVELKKANEENLILFDHVTAFRLALETSLACYQELATQSREKADSNLSRLKIGQMIELHGLTLERLGVEDE